MPEPEYDNLIVGSTPLAGLLAARLAITHGRRVCLVREPFSPLRLARSFTLSVDIITRPDTLSLLAASTDETLKFLAGLGKGLVDRVGPLFVAETTGSMGAVAHFRHLAQALGFGIEQIADPGIAEGVLCQVRGVHSIAPDRLAPRLEEAFARHGVRVLDRSETTLVLRKDGTARLSAPGLELQAAQTTFADDTAIVAELEPEIWEHLLVAEPRLAVLTEPSRQPAMSVFAFLDRNVVLWTGESGSLSAIVAGNPATAHARLGASTRKFLPLRRVGTAGFTGARPLDAAPVASAGRGHKALLIAGFGLWGAFFAPALARLVADKSTPAEAAWFAARGHGRSGQRAMAADFVSASP